MRESISATTRLLITLRYLATGNTYTDLSYGFRVSIPSISQLVPDTLNAIIKVLAKDYLKGCTTQAEWKRVADSFYRKWNFPMCLGAIDGKHIAFRAKSKDGSYYYNYKGYNSIILLAIVDANYRFIMVDVGRANDAAAFNASAIGNAIKNNFLNFPENEELPGTNTKVPYVFVSDDAFRLSSRILKPYSQRQKKENKIFNYRLSRARRVAENAFGILANRFQIFFKEINLPVEKVEIVTLACCALHNFILRDFEEQPPTTIIDLCSLDKAPGNNYAEEASEIRDTFSNFFNNVDILPWQEQSINKFNF
ncbi:putative nuclease HARBI1 [Lucilia sericata]|uniref:putative nuclease HARBI1 n=1 Tax=Lucilia sericata TaxID=13632 RepID=UPI0018A839EF|nr:putative nuclease HARBI1 [Lucilia sericata]